MIVPKHIIKNAQNGNEEAIDYIIHKCTPIVNYMAKRSLRSQGDGEDCVQVTMERIIRKLPLYDPKKTAFTTWFYTVAQNAIMNYQAVYNKTNQVDVELNDAFVYEYTEIDTEKIVMDNKLSEIEMYLGPELYEILILRIGYEMTFYEISEVLNMPYHKAKREFKSAYKLAKEYTEKMK